MLQLTAESKYEESLELLELAERLCLTEGGGTFAAAIIDFNKAQTFRRLKQFDRAVEHYNKSRAAFEQCSLKHEIKGKYSIQFSSVLCGLGLALRDQDKMDESLRALQEMGQVHQEAKEVHGREMDTADHANHFKSWATVLCATGDTLNALEKFTAARRIFETSNKTQNVWYADTLTCIAKLHLERHQEGDYYTDLSTVLYSVITNRVRRIFISIGKSNTV